MKALLIPNGNLNVNMSSLRPLYEGLQHMYKCNGGYQLECQGKARFRRRRHNSNVCYVSCCMSERVLGFLCFMKMFSGNISTGISVQTLHAIVAYPKYRA